MPGRKLTEEEQAVLDVIAAETAAAYRKDRATWEPCWAHEPTVRRMGWSTEGGVTDTWGWNEIRRVTLQSFDDDPVPFLNAATLWRENLVIHADRDMAYATFDEYAPKIHEPEGVRPTCGRAGRVLRQMDGQWRIVYSSFLVNMLQPARSPMFRVSRNGAVGWMNQSAELAIKQHHSLAIVAGHLVAKTARDTQAIRSAIRTASDRDELLNGGRVSIPILIEQEADDAVCVCWVVTEGAGSGSVLVSLNNLTFALDKIDAASTLFGLSPAQQRMAELIASGHDMVASAGLLGITANTARTHLQRIYDKTGARSQAALVRTLLSIERPE